MRRTEPQSWLICYRKECDTGAEGSPRWSTCRAMKRVLALAVVIAGASAALPAAAQAPFGVLNRTGLAVMELNAVRSPRGTGGDWGRNLLSRPLAPNGSFSLRPSESAGCRFDIRLLLADGREARMEDQDICAL